MIGLFTNSEAVVDFSCSIMLVVQMWIFMDFCQGVLCGTIKALG